MRMRQPYNLVNWCEVITFCHQQSNSKRWIKQKEHKKANVDQELEPKKRPSKERAEVGKAMDNILRYTYVNYIIHGKAKRTI